MSESAARQVPRYSFDKVASATDPRAQFASYTYTTQGLPMTVTARAETAGIRPVATFT